MLATSRESLRITGEKELPLAPLSLPRPSDPPEDIATSPAVELFVARAKDVRPGFTLAPGDASIVAEVCRRLDGLPLAIELAAARVKVLSLPALNDRLAQGLKVLTSGRRDATVRHRTLRGAIAWSYDLLSEDEQALFRRLGVFAGGWTLDAAEQVCDRGDLSLGVLDSLASLIDKSLVRTNERRERFSMLETIRAFAAERLDESGEVEEIRRAHAEVFRQFVEEAEPHLIGPEQKQWLDRLETDLPNLRETAFRSRALATSTVRTTTTGSTVAPGPRSSSGCCEAHEGGTRLPDIDQFQRPWGLIPGGSARHPPSGLNAARCFADETCKPLTLPRRVPTRDAVEKAFYVSTGNSRALASAALRAAEVEWNGWAVLSLRFRGRSSERISSSSCSQGESQLCQQTKAFSPIQRSSSASSPLWPLTAERGGCTEA